MRRLPPFVQRKRAGFRGWAYIEGKRVYGPTRDDALDAHRDAVELRKRGSAAYSTSLGRSVERMLAEMERTRSAGTVDWQRNQWRAIFLAIPEETPVHRINATVLRHLIRTALDSGRSAQSVQHYRSVLSRFFRWLKRSGQHDANPVEQVDWPRADRIAVHEIPGDVLRDILARMAAEEPESFDVVAIMFDAGLRRSEAARCHASHIDLAAGLLWIRGKARNESVVIGEETMPVAARFAQRGGFLVPGENDDERTAGIVNLFRRWARRMREPRFHPHALRHTLATMLARAGVPAPQIQIALRHSCYQTTMRYVHLVAGDAVAAKAKLRVLPQADHG